VGCQVFCDRERGFFDFLQEIRVNFLVGWDFKSIDACFGTNRPFEKWQEIMENGLPWKMGCLGTLLRCGAMADGQGG